MSAGRANLSPIYLFSLRLSKGNRPFDTPFHRPAFHSKHRIFRGVEGFKKLPEIVDWHLLFLLWPQHNEDAGQHAAS
jgi:hypothetical protein